MNYITGNIGRAYIDVNPDKIVKPWQADFEAEVAAGNFVTGGKSLLLTGKHCEVAAQQWVACLNRVNMPAYRTTAMEIVRRLEGKVVPRDNPQRTEEFEAAETFFIFDFFVPSDTDEDLLHWFLQEALRDGIVLVIVTEEPDPDLECHGESIGQLIEENFEVIAHVTTSDQKKPKVKGRNRKYGGASTVERDNTGHKRDNIKGN